MKVSGPNGISTPGVGQGGKRPSGSGFALPQVEEPTSPAGLNRAYGVSAVGSLDALLALQEVDEGAERKRKAIQRGGRLLDLLERLKLSLLNDELGEHELQSLAAAVREQRAQTGDPGLEALLDQIETRAAVELAKRQPPAG
jgi:hypothetical protein